MADKKYQIFISSTYSDLIEERRKILNILLADCIPVGTEAFVATDVEQFEVIKKLLTFVIIIYKKKINRMRMKKKLLKLIQSGYL